MLEALHAGQKRPGAQLQPERHRSEALQGSHREVLRGDQWKLQRVRSLSALPSDADLLAGLKGEHATYPLFIFLFLRLMSHTHVTVRFYHMRAYISRSRFISTAGIATRLSLLVMR